MRKQIDNKIIELLDTIIKQNRTCALCQEEDAGRVFLDVDGIDGMQLDRPALFESCGDSDAMFLLQEFIKDHNKFGFNLSCQLSRLLVSKGHLCKNQVEKIIVKSNWKRVDANFFVLSYAAKMVNCGILLPRLLDDIPEDFRDGIFLAFYSTNEILTHDALMARFLRWNDDESWTPNSTGELRWLAVFIKKWCKIYSFSQLEHIIKVYFEHV